VYRDDTRARNTLYLLVTKEWAIEESGYVGYVYVKWWIEMQVRGGG
jgi:hypothetical protein